MLTDRVAGANSGIVNNPIIMTIYSNTVPDLTLGIQYKLIISGFAGYH